MKNLHDFTLAELVLAVLVAAFGGGFFAWLWQWGTEMKNRHPYKGYAVGEPRGELKHIVGGPLTGWLLSDAVRQISCPRCKCDAGYHCQRPSGREAWPPHTERIMALP